MKKKKKLNFNIDAPKVEEIMYYATDAAQDKKKKKKL